MKYDVVVVGGGPAGSVTARFAAEGGAKVLVIERRKEIGVPVLCGEGISKKIDSWGMLDSRNWISREMDGARIYSPNKTMVKLSAEKAGNETGYVIHRDLFDQELARKAMRAGAEYMMNTKAVGLIKEDGRIKGVKAMHFNEKLEIEADIVVGADGVESNVGKWAGIDTTLKPKDIESCLQYTLANVDCEDPFTDFFLGKKIAPGGYIWVFPKGKDVANVGIGVLGSLSRPGLAKKLLDDFIKSDPRLRKGQPLRVLAGAVPVSLPIKTVKDNLILVGDAARQVDPLTGGGLTHCLEVGKIAGEVVAEAVNEQNFSEEFLMKYERMWKERIGKKLERNYKVKELMLDLDDKTLDKFADSLKDYNFDEFSTKGLIKALVKKHPSLFVKLIPLVKG